MSISWLGRRLVALSAVCGLVALSSGAVAADPDVEQLKTRVAQLEAEVKDLRARLAKLEGERNPGTGPVKTLKFTIVPGDWGDADPENILAICRSAASEMSQYFPQREQDPISIRHDAKQGPMVVFGKGADGERRVLLNARDRYWSQYAFQFAHEFCHIQCNYRDGNKHNLWFEESLCETASLFVMRRMAETWKTKPPYSNWKSQSTALQEYAEQRLKDTEKLDGLSFSQWYQRNEPELSKTGVNRKKNQVVAAALLPLFEKNPEHWEAVKFLNQWDPQKELSLRDYLRDWHERVPQMHRAFVAEIAGLFEITVK
jgi:hypothetical protein